MFQNISITVVVNIFIHLQTIFLFESSVSPFFSSARTEGFPSALKRIHNFKSVKCFNNSSAPS